MDEELTSPSLRDAKKNKRGQHVKQAMVGPSVDEPLSVSLSFFSRRGGAPQSVTSSNAPAFQPLNLSLFLSRLVVFRASNSLEAVVLLVQTSSAAVVDEHVQEHHRSLSLCLSVSSAPGAPRLRPRVRSRPGSALFLGSGQFSNHFRKS